MRFLHSPLLTLASLAITTPVVAQTPSTEISVLVTVTARPGLADEVANRFRNPQSRCTAEVGCLGFDIYRSEKNPDRVVVLERWASLKHHQEFFDAAKSSPGFETFLELVRDGLHLEYLRPHKAPSPALSQPSTD